MILHKKDIPDMTTKKKPKIYISLPISGHPYNERKQTADLTAAMLSRNGYDPVNPFMVYAGTRPDYEDHICADLRAMLDCDAIYFCEGWEKSLGCNIEHDTAMRFMEADKKNFKIIYE